LSIGLATVRKGLTGKGFITGFFAAGESSKVTLRRGITNMKAGPLDEWFQDYSFEQFIADLRCGRDLSPQGAAAFEQLLKIVAVAIGSPDSLLTKDAVSSAVRSFLGRLQNGDLELTPDNLRKLLIRKARAKRTKEIREINKELAAGTEIARSKCGEDHEDTPEEISKTKILEFMADQLKSIYAEVNQSLKVELHRKVLPYWYQNYQYQNGSGEKIHWKAIAARVGSTERTVRRIKKIIEGLWYPLVGKSKQKVQEFICRLSAAQEQPRPNDCSAVSSNPTTQRFETLGGLLHGESAP
jgi:hypothetical protein